MKQLIRCLAAAGVICAVISCASTRPVATKELVSEVTVIKSNCEKEGILSPEMTKGDSLWNIAEKLQAQKQERQAYAYYDYAKVVYRLAYVKYELARTMDRTKELEASLSAEKLKLEDYEKTVRQLDQTGKK